MARQPPHTRPLALNGPPYPLHQAMPCQIGLGPTSQRCFRVAITGRIDGVQLPAVAIANKVNHCLGPVVINDRERRTVLHDPRDIVARAIAHPKR